MSAMDQQQRSARGEEQPDEVAQLKFRVQLLEGEVHLLLLRNLGIHGNLEGLGTALLYNQTRITELESTVMNLMNRLRREDVAGQRQSAQPEHLPDDSVFLPPLPALQKFQVSNLRAASNSRPLDMASSLTSSSATQGQASGVASRRKASDSQFPLPPPPKLRRFATAENMELAESDADQPSSGTVALPSAPVAGGKSANNKIPVAKKPRKSRAKGGGRGKGAATAKSVVPIGLENEEKDSEIGEKKGNEAANNSTTHNGEESASQVVVGRRTSKGRISNVTLKADVPGTGIKDKPSLAATALLSEIGKSANTKQRKSQRKRASGSRAKRAPRVKKIKIVSNGETLMIAGSGSGPAASSKAKKTRKGKAALGGPLPEVMHKCTRCAYNFVSELELAEHAKLHAIISGNDGNKLPMTTENAISGTASVGVGSCTPEFNCSICYRGFMTHYHLQAHAMQHASR